MTGPQLGRNASGVPRTDLSGLFAPPAAAVPDRTQGVPRLTRPPAQPAPLPAPTPPVEAPPAAEVPPATHQPPSQPAASRRRRAPAQPRAKAKTTAQRHPDSVVVYLPISLRGRLRAHAQATGRSYTQIVFDALNAVHPRLPQLVATADVAPPADGLFVAQASGRRIHTEDQVQVSIRPNPANLAVIDRLADTHTAGNRSALVTVALQDHLPAVEDTGLG